MYNIIFFALLFLLIPLLFFAIFSWAILYHIIKYGFKKSTNRRIALFFSLIMIALALSVVQKFFTVDWNSIDLADFLRKSNLNMFIGMYGGQ